MNDDQDEALREVVRRGYEVEAAQQKVLELRARLGQAIGTALELKVPAGMISEELNYSRARIYQLKDLASAE